MERLVNSSAEEIIGQYRVVVLPAPLIVHRADIIVPLLSAFAELGGSVWIGFRSDIKDERSQMRRKASRLAELAGVFVEEIESLNTPTSYNLTGVAKQLGEGTASATVWREGLRILNGTNTSAIWAYNDGFFGAQGFAAVTRRTTAAGGELIYVATGIDYEALVPLASASLAQQNVEHAGMSSSSQIEQMIRADSTGARWRIAINHGAIVGTLAGGGELQPYEVRITPVKEEIDSSWSWLESIF
mmetsp:Transcript_41314/g.108506  ORF Transcript_41314/g.108506 Transcript_41314/m.108506 type:complete len:244 (+) Transcript_41314:1482-2213(+)